MRFFYFNQSGFLWFVSKNPDQYGKDKDFVNSKCRVREETVIGFPRARLRDLDREPRKQTVKHG